MRTQAPWIAARFVDNRNIKWIPRIESELKRGQPTAIVAGALHFSGPNSVVKLLEKRGYVVKRVNAQGEAAAIHWKDGWLEGAPDPRTEGTAEGH